MWFDATTQKIWITDNNAEPTEPTEPTTPASDIVVYFANPVNNGWTTVCNYIWKSNTSELKTAWPGDEFTDSNVCQSDYSYNNVTYKVYKVTVPAAYDSIILIMVIMVVCKRVILQVKILQTETCIFIMQLQLRKLTSLKLYRANNTEIHCSC